MDDIIRIVVAKYVGESDVNAGVRIEYESGKNELKIYKDLNATERTAIAVWGYQTITTSNFTIQTFER